MNTYIEDKLERLSHSKFRSKFHLSEKDKKYVTDKGLVVIKAHAIDFVNKRLRVRLQNDGKQTPFKGHPVFIAQHATATCCRECLFKWHRIREDVELNDYYITYIVDVIMSFIEREME